MPGASSESRICHVCGATLSPTAEFCQTCHVVDQWMLAVETSNLLFAQLLPDWEIRSIGQAQIDVLVSQQGGSGAERRSN